MATLEARSVVGLAGAEQRGRRAETSGETGSETRGGDRDGEDALLDDSDGERILLITAIKNRFSCTSTEPSPEPLLNLLPEQWPVLLDLGFDA